jgi:hypothetical protein
MAKRKQDLIERYMDVYTFRVHNPRDLSEEERYSLCKRLRDSTYESVESTNIYIEVFVADYKKFIDILIKPLPEESVLAEVQEQYRAFGLEVPTSYNVPNAGPR